MIWVSQALPWQRRWGYLEMHHNVTLGDPARVLVYLHTAAAAAPIQLQRSKTDLSISLTMGAVVDVLTAPYLSDSGGSGIITPLLFIKLSNKSSCETWPKNNNNPNKDVNYSKLTVFESYKISCSSVIFWFRAVVPLAIRIRIHQLQRLKTSPSQQTSCSLLSLLTIIL